MKDQKEFGQITQMTSCREHICILTTCETSAQRSFAHLVRFTGEQCNNGSEHRRHFVTFENILIIKTTVKDT